MSEAFWVRGSARNMPVTMIRTHTLTPTVHLCLMFALLPRTFSPWVFNLSWYYRLLTQMINFHAPLLSSCTLPSDVLFQIQNLWISNTHSTIMASISPEAHVQHCYIGKSSQTVQRIFTFSFFFFNEDGIHYTGNCGNLLRCKTTFVTIKDFSHQHQNIFLENPCLARSSVANGSE